MCPSPKTHDGFRGGHFIYGDKLGMNASQSQFTERSASENVHFNGKPLKMASVPSDED